MPPDLYEDYGTKNVLDVKGFEAEKKNLEGITFCLQNIRSATKNLDVFFSLINSLNVSIDIFSFTETWGQKGDMGFVQGFDLFTSKAIGNKASGSCLYVNSTFNASEVTLNIDVPKFVDSCIVDMNCIQGDLRKLYIGSFYRSPSGSLEAFNEYWEALLQYLMENNIRSWLSGDFNIDISGDTNVANNFIQLCSNFGFRIIQHGPTRFGTNSSSTLDISITNIDRSTRAVSVQTGITDHCTMFACLNVVTRPEPPKPIGKWNIDLVVNELVNVDFSNVLNDNDLNSALQSITSSLQTVINRHTSYSLMVNKYDAPDSPWMTQAILVSLRRQRKLFTKVKQRKGDKLRLEKYKAYRNKLTIVIRDAKRRYFGNALSKAKGDSKSTWKVLNKLRNPSIVDNLGGPKTLVNNYGKEIQDPDALADQALEFLMKKQYIKPTILNVPSSQKNMNSIFLSPVTGDEIAKIMKSLKNKHSVGEDGIPITLLKRLPNLFLVFAKLCNEMLEKGFFPDILKTGVIKFKHKGGAKDQLSNFRQLTILNAISKIFEKVILTRLNSFIKKNSLISCSQFGFQENLSTEDAILALTKKTQESLADGNLVLAMSIDIASAFDSVPHDTLLNKLESKGFRGQCLTLLRSYLSKRTLYTEVQGSRSKKGVLLRGLPQGSILGPVLFSIFIDDLHLLEDKGSIISFADDNFSSFSTSSPIEDKLPFQTWINKQIDWYNGNGMSLNLKKCHFIVFGGRRAVYLLREKGFKINIGAEIFEMEENVKYLGVTLNSQLSWKSHVTGLMNSIAFFIPLFYRLRWLLDKSYLCLLIKTIVIPKIQYGLLAYGNTPVSTLKPLLVFMNRIFRIITHRKPWESVRDLYECFDILTIYEAYAIKVIRFVVKIQQGHRNVIGLLLERNIRRGANYDLRQYSHPFLREMRPKNSFERNLLSVRAVKLLNGIMKVRPCLLETESMTVQRENLKGNSWLRSIEVVALLKSI